MTAAAARRRPLAVVAEFPSAATLYQAAEQVRDKGYRFWDVYSPFPIHGMNKAMGLGNHLWDTSSFGEVSLDFLRLFYSSIFLLPFSTR